ncbi:MAG: tetratricopeptide repeat protein [Candidatus Acidiferrales bacterium]
MKIRRPALVLGGLAFLCASIVPAAQTPQKAVPDVSTAARQGLALAGKGRCTEALPALTRALPHIADKDLKLQAAYATARCAMSLNQLDTAVEALLLMNREYPRDPKVLYVTTHYFSEIASRASQRLAAIAPNSVEAHELEAEAFESQGKWDEAAAEYNKLLEKNPRLPEIHYRLGRLDLSRPAGDSSPDDAKREFEAELQIDPANAAAEFMLGDIARQAQQWDDAAGHFLNATKLDAGFAEAYLGLGLSLNALRRYSDAVAPLEKYVKMEPEDPAGHYQLSIAYARLGRKEDAAREMARQRAIEQPSQAPPQ